MCLYQKSTRHGSDTFAPCGSNEVLMAMWSDLSGVWKCLFTLLMSSRYIAHSIKPTTQRARRCRWWAISDTACLFWSRPPACQQGCGHISVLPALIAVHTCLQSTRHSCRPAHLSPVGLHPTVYQPQLLRTLPARRWRRGPQTSKTTLSLHASLPIFVGLKMITAACLTLMSTHQWDVALYHEFQHYFQPFSSITCRL